MKNSFLVFDQKKRVTKVRFGEKFHLKDTTMNRNRPTKRTLHFILDGELRKSII